MEWDGTEMSLEFTIGIGEAPKSRSLTQMLG